MNVNFLNGSDRQHEVVRAALRKLLHLDLDRFGFSINVSFVPNPVSDPHVHHPFAVTTPGFPVDMKFRDDFPHFQVGGSQLDRATQRDYSSERFAIETVIHELGHAILHQLPSVLESEVTDLFHTTPAEMNPTNRRWEDRPEEGIAETFKDAFLPRGQREFSNRTNVTIPIRKYPRFRAIYRESAATGGEAFLEDFDSGSFVNPHDEGFIHIVNLLTDASQPDGWRISWLTGDQFGGASYPPPSLGSGLLRTNAGPYTPGPPFFVPTPPAAGAKIILPSDLFRDGVYEAAMIAPPLGAGACSGSVSVGVPDPNDPEAGAYGIVAGMSRDGNGVVTVSCNAIWSPTKDLWSGGLNVIDFMQSGTVSSAHVSFVFRITINGTFATFYIADRDTDEVLFNVTIDLTVPQPSSNDEFRRVFIESSAQRMILSSGVTSGGAAGDHYSWDYILYQPGGIEGEDVPRGEVTHGDSASGRNPSRHRVMGSKIES